MNASSPFPSALRELARTQQAFLAYAATHVHTLDLTLPQFDIILSLGNTDGMTFKMLGEKTIITKGTLTGIVNRLEDKGLVQRAASKTDGRSQIVSLTAAGSVLYERAFPEHLVFIDHIFNEYSPEDITTLEAALLRLRRAVMTARGDGGGKSADAVDGRRALIKNICKRHRKESPVRGC
ncbi:MarR family transcriptional regulator [Methylomicrobium sp. Wu6]|uniref:MarR family winged helix-turn-helix transcriptional regulator n=1 Tax=Methylomicrobium sp. Wu6 TaxID=3107928 RepID=UPI002DD6436C|nr:MarR family transcriptional regulator [Methylomicrobium sp. Wu6]MEC4749138.1 MarR family transcriptional regulator [Methylomicrobium sp. Wu6]